MDDADIKVEVNTNPPNANVQASEKRGFYMPLFEFPKMAMPGVFRRIAENSVVRVKENCEKMKAASGRRSPRDLFDQREGRRGLRGQNHRDLERQHHLRIRFFCQSYGHEVAVGNHDAFSRASA